MNRLMAWLALSLVGGTILADNTTHNQAAGVVWGQKVISQVNGPAGSHYWYRLYAVPGRSYCAEAGNAETTFIASENAGSFLSIFREDGTTGINSVVEGSSLEPKTGFGARACWIQPAIQDGEPTLVRVVPFNANFEPATAITLRFVETTLFCPWFFVAGDYNAFSLLRNTTNTALSGVVVTWRGLNGAVAGATSVTIPANGTVILNARTFVNPGAFSNGSIEVAHPYSPQAIVGSTTTLSGTTGLGFDALFEQRKPW